jgi:PadR family transcriptional regulator PadR
LTARCHEVQIRKVKIVVVLILTISRRGVSFLLSLKRNASMADKPTDLVQGTLDMLILKTLALEPMHGYGIAVRLEQMSKGVFRLNAGSLFVAFQRLQRAGLIRSEWKATENSRRAKYYVLTDQGRKRLNSETREWGRQVAAIARILEAS